MADSQISDWIASRRPGWSLPRPFYTDARVFAQDLEHVFRRHWLFAGHVGRIPRAGDYFTVDVGQDSIVVIRADDGQCHALHNVCRHRGSKICMEESGRAKKLVCPYHQWVYDCDGSLLAARHMEEGFDKTSFGLLTAHLRVVEGLIFINLSDAPPDFDPMERDVTAHLRPHDLPQARICHSRQYAVRANWKLILENSRECYHCAIGHPQYTHTMLGEFSSIEQLNAAQGQRAAACRPRWKTMGLETQSVRYTPQRSYKASRYPFSSPEYVSNTLDGQPVAPIMGTLSQRDAGVVGVSSFPNFMLEASSDHAILFRFLPQDPTTTNVEVSWLVAGNAVEGVDYDLNRLTAMWRATGEQDWKLCEDNQAGVNSSRYQPGPYSRFEDETDVFVQWYLNQVSGETAKCASAENS